MKKHLLLLLMAVVTLFTAGNFFVSLHAFRAQESAMDSMMRSYVLDLAENFSTTAAFTGGRGQAQRHGTPGMMRFRMLSADPALQSPDAGGILVVSKEGRIVSASPGAERLLPLWKGSAPDAAPREAVDAKGESYYVVVRSLDGGNFILAAVSRTYLLAPLTGVWKTWILSAMITSAAVLVGMFLLWYWLAVPLRWIAEKLENVRWGKERSVRLYSGPLAELEALSSVIGRLAEESFEKEELKKRYVTDLVQAQEATRGQLARELHDGALQSAVAAVKRIQLAKQSAPSAPDSPLRTHLDTAEEVVQTAADEIRSYCEALSPSWVKLGLSSALEEIAGRLAQAYEGVETDVDIGVELEAAAAALPEEHVLALARIFQEAASNSVRHGGARFIQVELRREGDLLLFSIEDDGVGFDADAYAGSDFEELRTSGHRGLANINERVRLLRGTMRIVSSRDSGEDEARPGDGCRIEILFPPPLPGETRRQDEDHSSNSIEPSEIPQRRRPHTQSRSERGFAMVRILLADDHPLTRSGLAAWIAKEEGMQLVGETEDGESAWSAILELHPDLAMLDIEMPDCSGIDIASRVLKRGLATNVLILTAYSAHQYVMASVRAGAKGFLLKSAPLEQLRKAIFQTAAGDFYLDPSVSLARTEGDVEQLSERELEVLVLAGQGLPGHEVARLLSITERTVAAHLTSVYGKLGAKNKTEAILLALKRGVILLDQLHLIDR